MKILHIIQGLHLSGGTSTFAGEIIRCQVSARHQVRLMSIPVPDQYPIPTACVQSRFSIRALLAFRPDIVHVHAVWYWKLIVMAWVAKCMGAKIVWSIHGGLMPRVFTKGRLKKLMYWHLFLKHTLRQASAIHCTAEPEKDACEKLGLPGPFVVAPLGVNLPEMYGNDGRGGRPGRPQRTVLFLGRLSEEKGLINLLDAWRQLQKEGTIHSTTTTNNYNYKLIIAGPDWFGYKAKLDAKLAADHIEGVEFPGLVQGEAKDKLYREADIFVLPSPMENFSMVVLDALAYGIPAIATKGTPWSELEAEHCGWWIEQGVQPLANVLRKALSTSTSDLHLLGQNGRALAERKYQWPAIAENLIDCYALIRK